MKCILLTLCVFLSACLIMAQERFTVGKYTYKVTSRAEVELVDVEETIQSSYLSPTVTYQGDTYYITSIGLRAFSYCSSLTSVVIPNGVRSIGGRAFQDCKALYSVTIPSSVVSIGWEAFLGCSSLLSIIIPESVTEIGDCAFYDCSSLVSIAIPETITEKVDLAFCGNTPRKPVEDETGECFMIVESMPEFPGGQQAMMKFLADTIKYPVIAQENGIQGRVVCQFVIEKDGRVTDIKVVRSSGDASLDKEAVRVIGIMPRWKPGRQRGRPVRVKYTIPINFRLQ